MSDQQRAQPESFRARSMNISLTVKDLKTSVDFYERVIGFTVGQEFEREGELRAARMVAGDIAIILNQDDGAKGWNRQKGEGVSFQFSTAQSVDAVAQRIKDNGGTLITEPADMPWGVRSFRVQDPDGFKFAISSLPNQ